MLWLLSRIRFIAVIISMAFMVLAIFVIAPFSLKFIRKYVRILWTRMLIASTGAKLSIKGYKLTDAELRNAMIVSNHISWLDTVVILRLCFVRYIGKVEMLNWPILKTVIKAGGTIFINRRNKKDILNVNQQVANYLKNGSTIGLYPEGKTSDGKTIAPFKAPILEAALLADSKIFPVVLNYRKGQNQLATEVTFARVNWLQTVMNTLKLKDLTINVTILPPINARDFSSRDILAEHLYKLISDEYFNSQNSFLP